MKTQKYLLIVAALVAVLISSVITPLPAAAATSAATSADMTTDYYIHYKNGEHGTNFFVRLFIPDVPAGTDVNCGVEPFPENTVGLIFMADEKGTNLVSDGNTFRATTKRYSGVLKVDLMLFTDDLDKTLDPFIGKTWTFWFQIGGSARQTIYIFADPANKGAGFIPVYIGEAPPPPSQFPQFSDGHTVADWAVQPFKGLIETSVVGGYQDGTLRPKGNVTRAEFTKMIVVGLNLSMGSVPKTFGDVNAGDWHKEFVDIASSRGIVNGVSDTEFAPNANITRQDLCAIAYRALDTVVQLPSADLADPLLTDKFPDDAAISDYAKDAVYTLRYMGIIGGRPDGNFDPGAYATREETAKIIAGVVSAAF